MGKIINAGKFIIASPTSDGPSLRRVVNKSVNQKTRQLVNYLEDKKIPFVSKKEFAKMRVAIELQAAKDGNQSWRTPKSKTYVTQGGDTKPSDLEDKHLTRLAEEQLREKAKNNPELLQISTPTSQPERRIYRAFPKLKPFVEAVMRDALPTAPRERIKTRFGYEKAIAREKEELIKDLTSPDRNPWITRYANVRKSITASVGEKAYAGARLVGAGIVGAHLFDGEPISETYNRHKKNLKDSVESNISNAKQFVDTSGKEVERQIRGLQKIPQKTSRKASEAKQYIENKVKSSFNQIKQPINISVQDLKNLYKQSALKTSNSISKRGLKKMHTPMKSVSVPYTRTLTDDSVPSPKKFMHKMMGGKTGRMGKELTGADGVKGRYFQKGQRMIKFYEVDKPHAPQMRSMGMGKLQKGKIATRMRIPSEGVLRGTMVDTMRGTSGKLRTTIKPSEYKSEVLHALFDAMPETSGMLSTTIKPKKSTRMTVASKPTKGHLSAYTKDRLKRGGELEDIRTAMAGTPTFHILSEPQYKGFKNFSQWKSQNETPRDLNRILTNAVRNKGIASRVKINAGDYNTPIVLPMMKKRATRKMHEITDENYYGNQKPRKKDEFRKNQGAFINGRKLKY